MNLIQIKRQSWNLAIILLAVVLGAWRISQLPQFGAYEARTFVLGILPIALLSMGQALIIIGGGINLAIGAEAVLINCLSAKYMLDTSFSRSLILAFVFIIVGVLIGALTGWIISVSGIADIVVTLATSFLLVGVAMYVMPQPGGGINQTLADLISGKVPNFIPPLICLILPILLIWIPLYRSKLGISMYAIGSNKEAAFLSGVNVNLTRIKLYAFGGLFAALSGLALTGITLSSSPFANISNTATLNSVAGAVLGGVALSGGVGGLVGPALAALILYFIPTILLAFGIDPAYSQIITGALTIVVVLLGGLLRKRTAGKQ
ncbi:MAG: ABC transporter permease [Candidatus Nanopelagicus sp.]|nr:ABC transporter permease [Candidatus Nanopelagicus sp.]